MASGIPGLSDLPVVGHLFSNNRRETQETDIVLTLTPRIVRVLDLSEEDLRPFRVGRAASGGGGIIDLPLALEPPATQPPSPAPDPGTPPTSAPIQLPQPAAPIQPPAQPPRP